MDLPPNVSLTVRYDQWYDHAMNTAKITISISPDLLERVDRLVKARVFPNRSSAIQAAVQTKVERLQKTRLARECAKLQVDQEQALADTGLHADSALWPPY